MQNLSTTSIGTASSTWPRRSARWLVTFVGFPLGGFAAMLTVGPVDSTATALAGGLITGIILGAVQAFGLRRGGPPALYWIGATGVGLMVGLGVGATVVGFTTTLPALLLQGAVTGLAVGTAQALVLRSRLGSLALAWPPALAVIWALGWAITTTAGVQVDLQFTVFGSLGAIAVTVLTAVLPAALNRTPASEARTV